LKFFSNNRFKININSDEPTGRLALVFELMEMNLYEAIKGTIIYKNVQLFRKIKLPC